MHSIKNFLQSPESLLPALVFAVLVAAGPAGADDAPRLITLTGHGEVLEAPDLATMTLGVVTESKTARDALDANSESMTRVIAAFKEAGIPDKDIRTANFSVQPQYFYERTETGNKPPRIDGYLVSNEVIVIVRDLDALGGALDRSVDVGANSISGPVFDIADRESAVDEARKRAAADATRKAELYAAALGVSLGPITAITESSSFTPPPDVRMRTMAMAEAAPASVPVEGGQIELSADVNVTWEIR